MAMGGMPVRQVAQHALGRPPPQVPVTHATISDQAARVRIASVAL